MRRGMLCASKESPIQREGVPNLNGDPRISPSAAGYRNCEGRNVRWLRQIGLHKTRVESGQLRTKGANMHHIIVPCIRWCSHSFALFVLLLSTLSPICSARARKDVIQFINGDRLTCEIIKLEKGYLNVKLDYADGTVAMDWSKIASVNSSQSFVVADKAGKRYTGSLQSDPEEGNPKELQVKVIEPSKIQMIDSNELVQIHQIETTFWQSLHGGLDAGVNYAKQQNRTQYNFQTNALFERTKWLTTANYESSFSGGRNITDLRNDLRLKVIRQLLLPRNFCLGLADFLQSDEQQLNLRTTLGGAVGHMFSYTNNNLRFWQHIRETFAQIPKTSNPGWKWNRSQFWADFGVGDCRN